MPGKGKKFRCALCGLTKFYDKWFVISIQGPIGFSKKKKTEGFWANLGMLGRNIKGPVITGDFNKVSDNKEKWEEKETKVMES